MVFISHVFSGLSGCHDLSPHHITTPASHRPFGVLADVINQYLPPDLKQQSYLVASSRLCPLPRPLGMLVEMFQINKEWYYLIIFPKPSNQLPPVEKAKVIRTKRRIVLVNP
jgi:hypothetical protein